MASVTARIDRFYSTEMVAASEIEAPNNRLQRPAFRRR
jgi:hypothetical protein